MSLIIPYSSSEEEFLLFKFLLFLFCLSLIAFLVKTFMIGDPKLYIGLLSAKLTPENHFDATSFYYVGKYYGS